MRVAVFFVFGLLMNNVTAQSSDQNSASHVAAFNCEELTSHIQSLKESTRSKKEKFSCILNLLKGALSDELDHIPCQADSIKDISSSEDVLDEKDNYKMTVNKTQQENNVNTVEITPFDKLLAKITQAKTKDCINNTQNLEVPTMIPIFKPKPVKNDFDTSIHARPFTNPRSSLKFVPGHDFDNLIPAHPVANHRPSRVATDPVHSNSNPIYNPTKFTIPCQRAADVLDMSNLPRKNDVQSNVKLAPSKADHPMTLSVRCTDSNDSVAMLFKPKEISLVQLYGNLLKKITITVLVPYHMSKMGQK